eukprot:3607105-Pleurochrysis_carterae.AAC.1
MVPTADQAVPRVRVKVEGGSDGGGGGDDDSGGGVLDSGVEHSPMARKHSYETVWNRKARRLCCRSAWTRSLVPRLSFARFTSSLFHIPSPSSFSVPALYFFPRFLQSL